MQRFKVCTATAKPLRVLFLPEAPTNCSFQAPADIPSRHLYPLRTNTFGTYTRDSQETASKQTPLSPILSSTPPAWKNLLKILRVSMISLNARKFSTRHVNSPRYDPSIA
jgi:hypothetical protein